MYTRLDFYSPSHFSPFSFCINWSDAPRMHLDRLLEPAGFLMSSISVEQS